MSDEDAKRPPPGQTQAREQSRARGERERRNGRWALAALLVPLLFLAVIAFGLAAMHTRRMEIFRPAPSGRAIDGPPVAICTGCGALTDRSSARAPTRRRA